VSKIHPEIRRVLPELCDLVRKHVPNRPDVYGILAETFNCHPSLVQQYVLAERRRRRTEAA
jgi:hypothetical protein